MSNYSFNFQSHKVMASVSLFQSHDPGTVHVGSPKWLFRDRAVINIIFTCAIKTQNVCFEKGL